MSVMQTNQEVAVWTGFLRQFGMQEVLVSHPFIEGGEYDWGEQPPQVLHQQAFIDDHIDQGTKKKPQCDNTGVAEINFEHSSHWNVPKSMLAYNIS